MKLVDEIRRRIKAMPAGKSQGELAERLGVDRTAVNKIGTGKRRIYAEELPALISYLEIDGVFPLEVDSPFRKSARLLGVVEAGAWREATTEMLDHDVIEAPAYPDPRYAEANQYILQVRGTSMNREYPDGAFVYCVPYGEAPIKNGSHVHVERVDPDGRIERTLKVFRKMPDGKVELHPYSTDPRHQSPIRYDDKDGATVEIKGVVIGSFRPAP